MKVFRRRGAVVFFSTIYLAICPSPKGFAHDTGQAYIVLGESTDLGIGPTVLEKAWVPMFHKFLELRFFASSADLHNYFVFGATVGDILRDQAWEHGGRDRPICSHNRIPNSKVTCVCGIRNGFFFI
jgi:hypothetical protein